MADDKLTFNVEWFDSSAQIVRHYMLSYFLKDNSIEMVSFSSKAQKLDLK
jgi:hypothetical protein